MAVTRYHAGDRVIVPWGLGEATGTVVDVFGPPGAPFVMVRIDFLGDDEGADGDEIGFRAEVVRPVPLTAHG